MRIKELQLESFRNLRQFRVRFTERITVFIGKNGSGKSNLLEAVLRIFRGLYYINSESIPFDFHISYECRGKEVDVRVDTSSGKRRYRIKVDGEAWYMSRFLENIRNSSSDLRLLPDNVIAYYAGNSHRLEDQFKRPERAYSRRLKTKGGESVRPFFYCRPAHFQYLLLSLLSSELETDQKFLREKLRIGGFDSATLVIKRPNWVQDSNDHFWGVRGLVRGFLDVLRDHSIEDSNKRIEDRKGVRKYAFDIPSFESLFNIRRLLGYPSDLFKVLDASYYSDVMDTTLIKVKLQDSDISVANPDLSEGEQQIVALQGLSQLLPGKETLFLMDEPDTFLHPSWQRELISELQTIGERNQIIIATHSPLLLSNTNKGSVFIIEKGAVVAETPLYYGKDNNSILYTLMGVEERPREILEKIGLCYQMVENGNLEQALELLAGLEIILGEDDVEVTRIKTLMNFMKS